MIANFEPHFESWRQEARRLLSMNAKPWDIQWSTAQETLSLFSETPSSSSSLSNAESVPSPISKTAVAKVSPEFLAMARLVSMTRDDDKWSLLYRILYRMTHGEPELLNILIDPDILKFNHLIKSVKRDLHKMHAFVRFKEVEWQGETRYVAWHKPEHPCLEEGATFFVRRFGDKPWSIFTPDQSAHWDLKELTFTDGIPQNQFQVKDDFDELWKSYYASIFNPARIKIKAMKTEMAPKYWQSLPEVELIRDLVRDAPARLAKMAADQNDQAQLPSFSNWEELKVAAAICQSCPLYARATQTVFGEGPQTAKLMIVGEQPGDIEDQTGRLFVGPAGEVLNQCLQAAGIRREDIYMTNAVKHFKWIPPKNPESSGKARIHQKPSGTEMHACRPWLEAEIRLIKPQVILVLGVTAATSVLGRLPKIAKERGQVVTDNTFAPQVLMSWHPAAILRSQDTEEVRRRTEELTQDLRLSAHLLQTPVKHG